MFINTLAYEILENCFEVSLERAYVLWCFENILNRDVLRYFKIFNQKYSIYFFVFTFLLCSFFFLKVSYICLLRVYETHEKKNSQLNSKKYMVKIIQTIYYQKHSKTQFW